MKARDQPCMALGLRGDVSRPTADLDLGLDEREGRVRVGEPASRHGERQEGRAADRACSGRPDLHAEQLDGVGKCDRSAQIALRA